jgi:hypothetical protein
MSINFDELGKCIKINKFNPDNHLNMVAEIIIRKEHEWIDGKCLHCRLQKVNDGAIVIAEAVNQ